MMTGGTPILGNLHLGNVNPNWLKFFWEIMDTGKFLKIDTLGVNVQFGKPPVELLVNGYIDNDI